MGRLKATTISTSSGATKEKPVERIRLPPPMTGEGFQGVSASSQVELERLPLLVHRLAVLGPPFGVLEVLHGLVLLAGRELPELVLGQQRIEIGAGTGVGDHLGGLGLVLRQRHLVEQLV